MSEFIEKLIRRLEEKKSEHLHDEKVMQELGKNNLASFCSAKARTLDGAISIVNELAEEYKVSEMPTGWIPCSERLPKDDSMYLVTVEYSSGKIEVNFGWFDRFGYIWYVGKNEFGTGNVHAWQPLPAPYTEGE